MLSKWWLFWSFETNFILLRVRKNLKFSSFFSSKTVTSFWFILFSMIFKGSWKLELLDLKTYVFCTWPNKRVKHIWWTEWIKELFFTCAQISHWQLYVVTSYIHGKAFQLIQHNKKLMQRSLALICIFNNWMVKYNLLRKVQKYRWSLCS